ncbi:DUF4936 family protein [Massilia phyllosphaerae]|uniref:DUF4936 family protein n=1 Tax=Massilia phyllosphaerae TaxID=3106034 RepID=UPI002B1CDA62|nr:DUF4936 family protein [Massilia sp. SGZ-792]
MIDLYVYYKVREQDSAALEPRVRALQAALAARHAVVPQLKRRPEIRDGLQTWMEVYPSTDDAFGAALEAAARDAGLDTLITGPRRAEVFMDLNPCA